MRITQSLTLMLVAVFQVSVSNAQVVIDPEKYLGIKRNPADWAEIPI